MNISEIWDWLMVVPHYHLTRAQYIVIAATTIGIAVTVWNVTRKK